MKKLFVVLVFAFPLFVQAQSDSTLKYWDVALHIGPSFSGLPANLAKEMEAAGFKEDTGGLFGVSSNKPRGMARENPVLQGSIERITKQALSYKFLLSYLAGHVKGFSNRYGDLEINYSQITASFLVGYYSKQRITRIAAGPSLHFTTLKTASESSAIPVKENHSKAGFAIEAGLRFPAKSRAFFDFNTQYQFAGKQDLGTYNFDQTGEFRIGEKPTNYLCFNFGFGLRLGKALN
jgi:hypothetical protein